MRITEYTLIYPGAPTRTLALAADLHCQYHWQWISMLQQISPDLILSSGDMLETCHTPQLDTEKNAPGLTFLTEAAAIAPVYCSIGNHERGISAAGRALLAERGITVLDNEWIEVDGLCLGGISSTVEHGYNKWRPTPLPDSKFLTQFTEMSGFPILLCHHPEFWPQLIRGTGIPLTLSGHAHGGQWHCFGKDIFAPGQGLFPSYASGMHRSAQNEVLIVSRGMANTVPFAPRFGNPTELVVIRLTGGSP